MGCDGMGWGSMVLVREGKEVGNEGEKEKGL